MKEYLGSKIFSDFAKDLPDLYQHVGSVRGRILGKIGRRKEATGKGTNIAIDFI